MPKLSGFFHSMETLAMQEANNVRLFLISVFAAALLVACLPALVSDLHKPIVVKVHGDVLNRIDPRIFGQFMERPSWAGEIGPEAALISGTNTLRPDARDLIRNMQIPIVRFPGGTDVDHVDWLDMIDSVPGRPGGSRRAWAAPW